MFSFPCLEKKTAEAGRGYLDFYERGELETYVEPLIAHTKFLLQNFLYLLMFNSEREVDHEHTSPWLETVTTR
jgi:hypothetical protein